LSRFLELAEVLVLHDLALELDGGSAGVLSQAALESAVAQPQAEAFGQLLHATLYEQAAAYLFHLSKAHAFVDGNKRTAFLAMVTFLQMNGVELEASEDELFELCLDVAEGKLEKAQVAKWLEGCSS